MIALTENPAVIAPRKTLTRAQQDALLKVSFYKHQCRTGHSTVQIGPARVSISTIAILQRHKLLRGEVPSLAPTEAGLLAIERLKGEAKLPFASSSASSACFSPPFSSGRCSRSRT